MSSIEAIKAIFTCIVGEIWNLSKFFFASQIQRTNVDEWKTIPYFLKKQRILCIVLMENKKPKIL